MNDPATINTDDILLYKIQKYLPWFYIPIDTPSLIIHGIIALFSYIIYGSIIIFLIKNRKNKLFSKFFYHCVILNGFVDISFHLDNFFTSVLLSYEPFLKEVAPTEPSYWYAPLYYIGFFFTHFLYYNTFIISVNRMVMLTRPLKAKNIFENKKKLFTIFGIFIAGIPHLYLLVRPAYFSVSSSIYTNNRRVGNFRNVMWSGHEGLPLKITAINGGIFTIATLLVNLFNIYLLVKIGHKKIKGSDIKMTIYVILIFISQTSYTFMLFFNFFIDMNLEDKTILSIINTVRPWCFNIFCLFTPYYLIVFNPSIRKMLFKKINTFCKSNCFQLILNRIANLF